MVFYLFLSFLSRPNRSGGDFWHIEGNIGAATDGVGPRRSRGGLSRKGCRCRICFEQWNRAMQRLAWDDRCRAMHCGSGLRIEPYGARLAAEYVPTRSDTQCIGWLNTGTPLHALCRTTVGLSRKHHTISAHCIRTPEGIEVCQGERGQMPLAGASFGPGEPTQGVTRVFEYVSWTVGTGALVVRLDCDLVTTAPPLLRLALGL